MNINVKPTIDRDPFDQSDRDPIGRNAGKGDRDRSDKKKFKRNFPPTLGQDIGKHPGKRVFRYPHGS